MHRLNFIEEQFRNASRTSDVLKNSAIGFENKSISTSNRGEGHDHTNTVFIAGKIRKLAAMLKMSKYPPLPLELSHLSYEEFVISQSPAAVARLDSLLDRQIKIVTNYFIWEEKEAVFWTWVRQNINAANFKPPGGDISETALDRDAASQLTRIEKIEAALAKMPKPKFRPDMMKARSNRTLALMGEMGSAGNGPPVGVKKLEQETDLIREETSKILEKQIRTLDRNIIPVFP